MLQSIKYQIQHGMSKFISKTTNRLTVHEVKVRDKTVRVVWDKVHACVVTVLPGGRCE
jgi:hypothetical protein